MRSIRFIVSVFCAGLLASAGGFSQTAHAGSDWISILVQPLMKEVVVPALEKGVDTLQARHTKKHAPKHQDSYDFQVQALPDPPAADFTASDWKLPEEPVH
jgi:hypothetical protein